MPLPNPPPADPVMVRLRVRSFADVLRELDEEDRELEAKRIKVLPPVRRPDDSTSTP